ncbi:RIP metalloprotease RseP [Peptococcaceae bacterium]|nr:RIP metalloprotease RseP [Peptococcaceae bacterium]
MLTLMATIFVFGLLIIFHELGHFWVAKRAGVKVHEFSVGFGTKLISYQWGETVYNLRLIPLGGYVRMAGMDPSEEEDADYDPKKGFNSKTFSQRFAIIAAGPLMNFVLAVVLVAIVLMLQGMPVATTDIGEVQENSPAAQAGIKAGDRIVAINGIAVEKWSNLVAEINNDAAQKITLEIKYNEILRTITVTPQLGEDGRYIIGIIADPAKAITERVNPLVALWQGLEFTWNLTVLIITFLGKMIIGAEPPDVGGPVKIVSVIGDAADVGFFRLLQLAAFLSVNIAIFNLLPIPALDGARLVFLVVEKVRGKALDPSKEGFIHLVGFGLLILLILVVTYNDIVRLLESGG